MKLEKYPPKIKASFQIPNEIDKPLFPTINKQQKKVQNSMQFQLKLLRTNLLCFPNTKKNYMK